MGATPPPRGKAARLLVPHSRMPRPKGRLTTQSERGRCPPGAVACPIGRSAMVFHGYSRSLAKMS